MRLNYKRLGGYIRQVDVRNRDLRVTKLMGVSIQKVIMPSIANIVGTDMSTYKVVNRNQFVYGPVTSRNGNKVSIALFTEDIGIVSQAYASFEIIDTTELLPEYLMLWFMRPEFDRYARFMSHGSAREVFGWDEMCDVTLPVPDIKVQQQIVDEYNVVKERIDLNGRLIKTLEETAQAIYKQWFVNFEFPDENGKPYRSSGGKMIDSELGEIPAGWRTGTLGECFQLQRGHDLPYHKMIDGTYPVMGSNGVIAFHNSYTTEAPCITMGRSGNIGNPIYTNQAIWAHNTTLFIKEVFSCSYAWVYFVLKNIDLSIFQGGSAVPTLNRNHLHILKTIIPCEDLQLKLHKYFEEIESFYSKMETENKVCLKLISLLLAKLSTVEG